MRNLLILENTSVKALAQMIESGTLILDDKQVKWLIQDWTQVQTFSYLKAQTLQALHIEHYFQNPKYLVELAQGALSDSDLFQMISEFIEQNKTSLRPYYFNEHGTLLSFLSPSDYEPLALKWLEQHYKNKDFDIPFEIFHLAHNRHLKSLIKQRRSIDIRHVNIQQVDKEVASYCMNSDSALFVYQCLPQALQDDMDLALIVCGRNKQDYLKLSLNAQCHLRVLCYATNDFIAPYSDGDTYHIDKSALSLNKVPLEVVLHIEPRVLRHVMEDILYPQHDNDSFRPDTTAVKPKQIPEHVLQAMPVNSFSVGLAVRILQAQPHLIKKTTIQEKWLNSPEFNNEMPKIYRHLGQEEQHIVLEKILHGNSHDLYSFLQDNPAMFKTVLAKQTTEQKLDLLLIYEQVNANLHEHLQKMNLSTDFLRTYVEQFIKSFIEDTPSHYDEARIDVWKWIGQNMGEQAEKLQLRVLKSAMSTHNILYKAKTHLNKTELLGFIVQIEKIIQDNEAANPELLEERLKEEQKKERYNQALIKKLNSFKR